MDRYRYTCVELSRAAPAARPDAAAGSPAGSPAARHPRAPGLLRGKNSLVVW